MSTFTSFTSFSSFSAQHPLLAGRRERFETASRHRRLARQARAAATDGARRLPGAPSVAAGGTIDADRRLMALSDAAPLDRSTATATGDEVQTRRVA
jgi:hypothetical protein